MPPVDDRDDARAKSFGKCWYRMLSKTSSRKPYESSVQGEEKQKGFVEVPGRRVEVNRRDTRSKTVPSTTTIRYPFDKTFRLSFSW